jgi:hypothetical protein
MKTQLHNILIAVMLFLLPVLNYAQSPDLGAASGFVLFTVAGAFSTEVADVSVVTGDVGTNVGAFYGFPPGVLIGQKHVADPAAGDAVPFVLNAYAYLDSKTCGLVKTTPLGGGEILLPNIYCIGEAAVLNGDLTLDGQNDPNSLFIFQIDGAFETSVGSRILLINGASLCNVWWQVNGAFSLGGGSVFRGNVIAAGAIHLLQASSLFGRALSTQGAIDLHNNVVTLGLTAMASTISANDPTTFCLGDSVTLSGNIGGIWSTGETTGALTVKTSGDYFVTNTTICGMVISNHINVTVNPLPTASIISALGPVIFCLGDSVKLNGNVGGIWSTGESTEVLTVKTSGDYFVTNTNICGIVISNHIIVTVNPLPTASIISALGPVNFCLGDSVKLNGNVSGIWSTGESTEVLTVKTSGDYFVTNTNECGSITSNHINVVVTDCGSSPNIPISTWALVLGGALIAIFVFIRYRHMV